VEEVEVVAELVGQVVLVGLVGLVVVVGGLELQGNPPAQSSSWSNRCCTTHQFHH